MLARPEVKELIAAAVAQAETVTSEREPACVRRRSAKAPIDLVTKWTPAGTEAGGGRRENT